MKIAVVLAVALAGAAHAQTVYRCTGADGAIAFQDSPCEAGARGGQIDVPPINSFAPYPALLDRMADNASGRLTSNDILSMYGVPSAVNTTIVNGVVTKQYVFRDRGGTRYVYTRDGVQTGESFYERPRWPGRPR